MRNPNLVVFATFILLAFQPPGLGEAAGAEKGPLPKPAEQKAPAPPVCEVVVTNDKPLDSRAYAPVPSPDKKAGESPTPSADATPTLSKLLKELSESLAKFNALVAQFATSAAKTAKPVADPAKLTAELAVTHRVVLPAGSSIEIGTCLADVTAGGFLSTVTVTGESPSTSSQSLPWVTVEAHPTRTQSFLVKSLAPEKIRAVPQDLRVSYRHAAPPWRIARYEIRLEGQSNTAAVPWALVENPTPYSWSEKGTTIKLRDHGIEYCLGPARADPRSSIIQRITPVAPVRVETLSVVHLPDPDAKGSPMLGRKSGYLLINDSEVKPEAKAKAPKDPAFQDLAPAFVEIWELRGTSPAVTGFIQALPYHRGGPRWPTDTKFPFLLPYAQLLESNEYEQEPAILITSGIAYVKVERGVELNLKRTYRPANCRVPLLCLPPGTSAWERASGNIMCDASPDTFLIEMRKPVTDADSFKTETLQTIAAADGTANAPGLYQLLRCRKEIDKAKEDIEPVKQQLAELQARRATWESQSPLSRQRAMLRELSIQIDRCTRQVALHEGRLQSARIEFERILHGPWFAEQ